jgi:16S rRNA processing protein RimM
MKKNIEKEDFTKIGFVKKTHGVRGELLLVFDNVPEDVLEEADYLFFEVDGLLVPFFIKEISFRGDSTVAFLFDMIENVDKAREYCGCNVFINKNLITKKTDNGYISSLKGFSVIDPKLGKTGVITEISNYGGNVVATVDAGKSEVLLPVNDAIIISIDKKNKTLTLDCPEGLFGLNS